MAIKLTLSRYKLAHHLRVAAEMYQECVAADTSTAAAFQTGLDQCLDIARQLEEQDILGDVIVLED